MVHETFKKNGYIIKNNIISKKNCIKILKLVKKQKKINYDTNDKDYPFSKIENENKVISLNNNNKINKIFNENKILDIAHKITKDKKKIFFKKIYTKNAFDGDNEFFHQDFAYRYGVGLKADSYLQCFIALEDHHLAGGCLKVFKGSNKLGLIKHNLVMARSGMSKLTISSKKLIKISKKYKLTDIYLKAGSCIFFTYLTIHGSSSNASFEDQSRLVVQMHSLKDKINKSKNLKIWKKRSINEIKILKQMINSKKNRYKKTVN